MTNTETTKRVANQLQLRYWKALERAMAARVPDADRGGPGREPVTVSGYYEVPTVSGRQAWAYYAWNNGVCREARCTYDTDAERKVVDLIVEGADPEWIDGR